MKKIQLSQSRVALVDDEDYDRMARWKWSFRANSRTGSGCAVRNVPGEKRSQVLMHREILNAKGWWSVDHINKDGTDNRRENLRVCSKADALHGAGLGKANISGYKGVSFVQKRKMWLAQICHEGKRIHLGWHANAESAASAYNRAARSYFGDFAYLNKDDSGEAI